MKNSVPVRSRSVGSDLPSTKHFQDLPETEVKSVDNLPKEIRDKFNPLFANELNKMVRQKSQRRELLGFTDPAVKDVSDENVIDQLDHWNATLDRPTHKSLPRDLNRANRQSTSERALNGLSAHEALFGGRTKSVKKRTFSTPAKFDPPKQSNPLENTKFSGTNNSALSSRQSSKYFYNS